MEIEDRKSDMTIPQIAAKAGLTRQQVDYIVRHLEIPTTRVYGAVRVYAGESLDRIWAEILRREIVRGNASKEAV